MRTGEKLLSFTTYLKDRGKIWSANTKAIPYGDKFIITVTVNYQMQRGEDGEWVESSIQKVGKGGIGDHDYDNPTSHLMLECLMLAFGEDPMMEE